jgi:nucleotide-binding universal stress UspA family protein
VLPLKKILCPTDFSDPSYAALEHAVELATHFDSELCLLHVVPFSPVSPPDLMAVAVVPDDERLETAERQLREVAATRVPANVRVRCEVKMGYADKEIACAADDEHADLLVIATHGLTGWRHMVFGSTAEAIIRASHCPVLTIHHRPHDATEATE